MTAKEKAKELIEKYEKYLTEEELGMPMIPVRSMLELELFSNDIADQSEWGNFFRDWAEIQTSSSLSKDAILIKLAVTIKKELADTTPQKKKNKGWFKKGDSQQV